VSPCGGGVWGGAATNAKKIFVVCPHEWSERGWIPSSRAGEALYLDACYASRHGSNMSRPIRSAALISRKVYR